MGDPVAQSTTLQQALQSRYQRKLTVSKEWEKDRLWVCDFSSYTYRTRMLCPDSAAITSWTSI
jgi:hypothetical protein